MAKALLVARLTSALASAEFRSLFGTEGAATIEDRTEIQATESCTLSNLRYTITAGGSGTNSLRSRKNGANGNQLAQIAGTGSVEDATNTDSLTTGDTFNVGYTDTGTNSTVSVIAANIEFASGFGWYQGAANNDSVVFDVPSETRYLPLAGNIVLDGSTSEAQAGLKCRGATQMTALQVYASSNARTNTSTVKNRINGADGTGVCTIGAGVTGLITSTGLTDTIADGDTINASLTLDTGVEDLRLTLVCATLKSSDSAQDLFAGRVSGIARTAGATQHYQPIAGFMSGISASETEWQVAPKFAGTISNLRAYLGANTYGSDATLHVMKNGVSALTCTLTASGGAGWYENTSDTLSVAATDTITYGIDGGGSGSATYYTLACTITQSSGDTLTPALFSNTNTFYAPTVSASYGLTPSLFSNSQTFYSSTVTPSSTLSADRFDNSAAFFAPTVTASYALTASLFENSATFFEPVITGLYSLTPSRLDNAGTFYAATVTPGTVTLSAGLFSNANTFYEATIDDGAQVLEASLFSNSSMFYGPVVTASYELLPGLFSNAGEFYAAEIYDATGGYPLAGIEQSRPLEGNTLQYPLAGIERTYP